MPDETDLRYPIGVFNMLPPSSIAQRDACIAQIEDAPARLQAAVAGFSEAQFDTPYRPGGWTVRQVVHHLPDSHMNAFIRFKLALTETEPLIKPYRQELWAELADAHDTPIEVSLRLLDNLHRRWALLLRALDPAQWSRTFRHPEIGVMTLDTTLAMYAWHGSHHVAHITALGRRMRWNLEQ
jgi:uncharacterized damage-inducible protein DinB